MSDLELYRRHRTIVDVVAASLAPAEPAPVRPIVSRPASGGPATTADKSFVVNAP